MVSILIPQTGEKHEFEIAQEVANFVGCGVTTVIIARKEKDNA